MNQTLLTVLLLVIVALLGVVIYLNLKEEKVEEKPTNTHVPVVFPQTYYYPQFHRLPFYFGRGRRHHGRRHKK